MPCVAKMPERVGDRPGSGCRRDCLHRALVLAYRQERDAEDEARKLAREEASHGFRTEAAEWDADHPRAVTFHRWLTGR